MPTPLQLLEAIPGAHVDSAVFALSQGVFARRLVELGRSQSRSVANRNVLQTALLAAGAICFAELVVGQSAVESSAEVLRAILIRACLFVLIAIVNWQLIAARRRYARASALVRQHIRATRVERRARSRAEASSRAKNGFMASLSHELRTPLNAIIASADTVLRSPVPDAQRGPLRRIIKETTQLGKTLNEALELRRIEDYTVVIDANPINPVEIAREIVDLFEARAHEKGLKIELATTVQSGLSVAGDARRLRQVLANLIDNAIKFSTEGCVRVSVSFTPAPNAQCLSLLSMSVQDGGVGLTVAQRAALLAGNMTQPTSAGLPASGMGLAIAQRVVRLMGGEITVRSRPGEGSEFGFTIPVTVHNFTIAPKLDLPPRPSAQRRVLIVDDVAANRLMLQMFLEQQGFAADYASGGEEAIGLTSRNRYDAVLMDLNMPDLDGLTAAQRIRATERRDVRTVIVAVTASAEGDMRAKCFDAGMDGFFVKPLELRRFCADLTDLIAARQTLQSR